ncbi:MAG TPA: NAD(P)-dependent oxidoreductase [Candidatus Limnocylindrales bacterium]|nr:NAD(P)-dependent oxidoreductase [Candidatus Limnocylindrales bacterium]
MAVKRKVCMTGPTGITIAENALRQAGCELVLGKSLDEFREFRYERKQLIDLIGDAPILFPAGRDFIGADILDSCHELQAVVKSSIGIESVDVDAATDLGIICCNSPTPDNYLGVAEATIGLMVALFKRLKRNELQMRLKGWKEARNSGVLMLGKTVGIIGVGRIGQNVAKRLGPWGMKILGYDPYVKQETVASLGVKMVSLEELLREADVVTLHVVLTRETRGMIGMGQFKLMKPSAFIINTSRGPAINENDLIQALKENIIAGAALDVFTEEPTPMTNPLRQIDPERVILTPHTIGTNPGSQSAGQKMAAESILAILDGRIPDTVVNPLAIPRWKERFLS